MSESDYATIRNTYEWNKNFFVSGILCVFRWATLATDGAVAYNQIIMLCQHRECHLISIIEMQLLEVKQAWKQVNLELSSNTLKFQDFQKRCYTPIKEKISFFDLDVFWIEVSQSFSPIHICSTYIYRGYSSKTPTLCILK